MDIQIDRWKYRQIDGLKRQIDKKKEIDIWINIQIDKILFSSILLLGTILFRFNLILKL